MPDTDTYDRWLRLIDSADFRTLFVEELGWEPGRESIDVLIDSTTYTVTQVADYHGIRIWECPNVPDNRIQRLIDSQIRQLSTERLIIFHDTVQQQWKWPMTSDTGGRGHSRLISHDHYIGNRTDALLQRLSSTKIGINESPTVIDVLHRLRAAFDAEKITKSFYAKFRQEATELGKQIQGLPNNKDRDWYSALLMNRLMFIYFMQCKGFMDGDKNYLENRLKQIQAKHGRDQFYSFYTDFLIPLFHDGLGSSTRPLTDKDAAALVGEVPYINGGIFSHHDLETNNSITIPDSVFESIFKLFNNYQWHLDTRPTGNPQEINPDVLGYIFEQFINQKEQGAYYTLDDVTSFMTCPVPLPLFLDRLAPYLSWDLWGLVQEDPERYLWDSLSYGYETPLPDAVAAQRDTWPRPAWGSQAGDDAGLPGETWWEVIHRRDQYNRLLSALKSGQIRSGDDATTANINMEAFAIDTIDRLRTTGEAVAAWEILSNLKIIDLTCGSGAFLFAALKVLEALYGSVLDALERLQGQEPDERAERILGEVSTHPNRAYFILKHATLKNLYGVDLMQEAVEIARLRLFLKLVSVVDQVDDLEPLPDLDFNIKSGNVLVGALDIDSISADTSNILSSDEVERVSEGALEVAEKYAAFQAAVQTDREVSTAKRELQEAIRLVRKQVDERYFEAHRVGGETLEGWVDSHQPFHWFIEFPEVMAAGGFDAVIGNPPYVARNKIPYRFSGFATDSLPDIYAPCVERAGQILRPDGRLSMIIPISAQFSKDFTILRDHLSRRFGSLWVSTFGRNPAALFSAGLGVRNTIIVGGGGDAGLHVTKTHRWYDRYRPALFETLEYLPAVKTPSAAGWARPTSREMASVWEALSLDGSLGLIGRGSKSMTPYTVGFKSVPLYWLSFFMEDPPCYELDGTPAIQTSVGRLHVASADDAMLVIAILSSKLAMSWWSATSDDFHITSEVMWSLPINPMKFPLDLRTTLIGLGERLISELPNHQMFTKYAGKWMGNYVQSEMRDITDEIDRALAAHFGYTDLLPSLEHAYACVYKPTQERNGTLRVNPFVDRASSGTTHAAPS